MVARTARTLLWDLFAILFLFGVTLLICHRAADGGGGFVFQLGPNDHAYLSGFAPHYEVAGGVAARWTTYDAGIDLPLALEGGPSELSFRFSRVFAESAEVAITLDGTTVDRFNARGGEIWTRRVRLPVLASTPLVIGFEIDSHERRNLGLRLDWLRVNVGGDGRLRMRGWLLFLPPLFSVYLFILFRWGGLGRLSSILAVFAWIAAVLVWMPRDPFGFSHVARHVLVAAMGLSALAAAVLRRFPTGRWVIPIFVLGYLLKASILFHPSTFYPDVANARDYVEVFRETSGSLAERGVETQTRTNVGYPRTVGGKDYAFPYSPLYFLPYAPLSTHGAVEDAVRHVGLSAASLAVLPLFWIGLTAFGPRVGVLATLLWAFMPPILSRLLLALHATVVGNFLDLLVIAAVLALTLEPDSRKRTVLVAAATLASLLIYTSSLFSVSTFFFFMSILNRRLAPRLALILFVSGVVTVGWLYWPFLIAFFTEIIPALATADGVPSTSDQESVVAALARIPLFYGYLFPALVGVGFVLVRKRSDPAVFRLFVAYGLAFACLVGLRAFGAGVFKDLKEITFVAPLVALLSAVVIDTLSKRSRWGTVAAIALTVALIAFGASRGWGYLETYASPLTRVEVDASDY